MKSRCVLFYLWEYIIELLAINGDPTDCPFFTVNHKITTVLVVVCAGRQASGTSAVYHATLVRGYGSLI